MTVGWSVNLSSIEPGDTLRVELPTRLLYRGQFGDVIELVFWSERVEKWIHAVRDPFQRILPEGHVQVTVGDLAWLVESAKRRGEVGFIEGVQEIMISQIPEN